MIQESFITCKKKAMKIILEDGPYSYQVDWAKDPELEEGEIPTVEDCIESFLRLLENIHPKEKIAAYIEEGIQYSGLVSNGIK